MNILKEKIKLQYAFPFWRRYLKRIKGMNDKRIFLIGTPVHGNLGDHAIAEQASAFFDDYFQDFSLVEIPMPMYHIHKETLRKTVRQEDLIVISGGGWGTCGCIMKM